MLKNLHFAFLVAVLLQPSIAPATEGNRPPNIIVYLVDDMGWLDTSVPFAGEPQELNRRFRTPNMERLAREGMVFTDAYAAPVCTPSRVSLVTGMNPAHHKITNWVHIERDRPTDQDSPTTPLLPPSWNFNGLSPVLGIPHTIHATPLPRLLQQAGYFTVHAGKAHFGSLGTPGSNPLNLGYVSNIAGSMAGQPENYHGENNYGNREGQWSHRSVQNMSEYYGSNVYLTDALTSEALKPLDYPIAQHLPFFLYIGQYAVHLPNQPDPTVLGKYLESGLTKEEAGYAAMIESMDKSLGGILDFLDERGIADNTVVLFMSDNGGNSIAPAKGGVMHHGNAPLREGKGSVYEGGIREPMIVRWPGVVPPGSRTDAPVIIEDFFPTLLEIAGVSAPQMLQQIDGKSFLPVLKNPEAGDRLRPLAWHYPNKWKKEDEQDIDFMSAWRQGEWKLVYRMTSQTLEFYNLKDDLEERRNLADQHPEKVAELAKAMSAQFRKWGALMPTRKKDGRAVPLPDEILPGTANLHAR